MELSTMDFAREGAVGLVTFTRPAELNSLSEAMFADLEAVIEAAEGDPSLRALVLTGQGKAFCVGLDLDLLDRAFADISYFEAVVRRLAAIVARLEALPVPTVAAVNGFARAGGFELAMGCDFIVIGTEAKIGDAHTDSGVLPATVSRRLARRVGEQRAKDLLWTARWLDADEAVSCGLALKAFAQDGLVADTIAFLRTMIDKPAPALAALKRSLAETASLSTEEATEHELRAFVQYQSTEPFGLEGYMAFREKRKPTWRGDA